MVKVRLSVLLAILLGFAVLKLTYNPYPVGPHSLDGSIYYQVASQFAAGEGLTSRLSDIGQGVARLPNTSPWYPLWPFLLGMSGKLIGLERAASVLPELFYFAALVLFYVLINALIENPVISSRWPVDVGHLAVLMFGLNPVFFKYTSLPFTEGLAFCLMFGTALVLIRATETDSARLFLLAGLLAGLCYLCRSQNALMMGFVPLAVLILTRSVKFATLAALPGALIVGLWGAHLYRNFDHFTTAMLLDTNAVHETPELEQLQIIVSTTGPWHLLKDRLKGFAVAFNPLNTQSYFRSFGMYVLLIPLAFLLCWPGAIHWKRSLIVLAVAIGPLIAVHLMHQRIWGGWNFQFRHGLPLVLVLGIALAMLCSRGRFVRFVTVVLVGVSFLLNAYQLRDELRREYLPPTGAKLELIQWINTQPGAVFLTTKAWDLTALTKGRFHAGWCDVSTEQLSIYDKLNVTDVIVWDGERENCRLFERLAAYAVPRMRMDGVEVWRLTAATSLPE